MPECSLRICNRADSAWRGPELMECASTVRIDRAHPPCASTVRMQHTHTACACVIRVSRPRAGGARSFDVRCGRDRWLGRGAFSRGRGESEPALAEKRDLDII